MLCVPTISKFRPVPKVPFVFKIPLCYKKNLSYSLWEIGYNLAWSAVEQEQYDQTESHDSSATLYQHNHQCFLTPTHFHIQGLDHTVMSFSDTSQSYDTDSLPGPILSKIRQVASRSVLLSSERLRSNPSAIRLFNIAYLDIYIHEFSKMYQTLPVNHAVYSFSTIFLKLFRPKQSGNATRAQGVTGTESEWEWEYWKWGRPVTGEEMSCQDWLYCRPLSLDFDKNLEMHRKNPDQIW